MGNGALPHGPSAPILDVGCIFGHRPHGSKPARMGVTPGCQWFQLGLEVFSHRIELSVIQNHCMIAISARQESRKNFMEFEDAM